MINYCEYLDKRGNSYLGYYYDTEEKERVLFPYDLRYLNIRLIPFIGKGINLNYSYYDEKKHRICTDKDIYHLDKFQLIIVEYDDSKTKVLPSNFLKYLEFEKFEKTSIFNLINGCAFLKDIFFDEEIDEMFDIDRNFDFVQDQYLLNHIYKITDAKSIDALRGIKHIFFSKKRKELLFHFGTGAVLYFEDIENEKIYTRRIRKEKMKFFMH